MKNTNTAAAKYTTAQMATIEAVRTMYNAACFVDDPTFIAEIKRAWFADDMELLAAHADGLVLALGAVVGGWDMIERMRFAQRAIMLATPIGKVAA